jgi:predicted component of type VI protein secretion system
VPRCPAGHDSATTDFCDVCGTPMNGTATLSPARPAAETPAAMQTCPACGAPRTGRFCEVCGHDSTLPAPSAAPPATAPRAGWSAVVEADHDYYRRVMEAGGPDAASISLPAYCPERRFMLTGQQVRVGRRSVSRGLTPEIDLSGPPEDPGVSHLHAVLLAQPDGGWAVLDPGSTNGTTINDDPNPIRINVPIPLADGDRIHIGAWTTITLRNNG